MPEKLERVHCELWPTLVHVHIATEVLSLHPGKTDLCLVIKVWLVTLIGLANSLSARFPDQGSKWFYVE